MSCTGGSSIALRQVIDAKAVARQLGVSPTMVYKLIRQGKLEGYAVGRRKLIFTSSLDRYRQQNAFGEAQPASAPQESATPNPRRRRKPAPTTSELPARRHLR